MKFFPLAAFGCHDALSDAGDGAARGDSHATEGGGTKSLGAAKDEKQFGRSSEVSACRVLSPQ
jgi:hypothetical protein